MGEALLSLAKEIELKKMKQCLEFITSPHLSLPLYLTFVIHVISLILCMFAFLFGIIIILSEEVTIIINRMTFC